MKLVIDIDENVYTRLFDNGEGIAMIDVLEITKAIRKGETFKTGHWIWCGGSHKCSNCEECTCFNHKELLRYCPNCGAKMR